jgi:hypothetical protein
LQLATTQHAPDLCRRPSIRIHDHASRTSRWHDHHSARLRASLSPPPYARPARRAPQGSQRSSRPLFASYAYCSS